MFSFLKMFKIIEYPLVFLCFPLIFICLCMIRLVKRWKHIRFGYFAASRIGHFVADAGIAFSEKKLTCGNYLDFYFIEKPISNYQWLKMVSRNFHIYPFIKYFYKFDKMIWKNSMHRFEPTATKYGSRDIQGTLQASSISMSFSKEEEKFCVDWLHNKGWRKEKFVCLIVRDEAYLQKTFNNQDYSYHNYRDSNIRSYRKSVEKLNQLGYWVIRMGKIVKEKMNYNHEKFIDYPFLEDQSDLLDIWLMANSYFTITSGTGIDAVSDIYLRPMIYVNFLPLPTLNSWRYAITAPKFLSWKQKKRYLTLNEGLEHCYLHSEKYQEAGILIEDLSEDDILNVVLELESRLNNSWVDFNGNEEFENKFWRVLSNWKNFSKYHGWLHPEARVGSYFLNKVGSEFFN
ncbi:TIGR04372 family glycosyltransferase [Leptospira santarosai]|uniref:TIGR04372 family glycosyltransferase n=1 Tax=Leptospira santarosai TaxID=28183 RepID=UPI0031FE1FBD|nr:TIGR04372 family glycosyltransferase [Leptospira santarosai]